MFPFTSAVLQVNKLRRMFLVKSSKIYIYIYIFMKESLALLLLLFLDRLCKKLNKSLCLLRGYLWGHLPIPAFFLCAAHSMPTLLLLPSLVSHFPPPYTHTRARSRARTHTRAHRPLSPYRKRLTHCRFITQVSYECVYTHTLIDINPLCLNLPRQQTAGRAAEARPLAGGGGWVEGGYGRREVGLGKRSKKANSALYWWRGMKLSVRPRPLLFFFFLIQNRPDRVTR